MSECSIKSIFLEAVEKYSPDQWDAYLDENCKDAETRRRVEVLLHAHQKADSILDHPGETTDQPPITERPGNVIGRYKLLEQIGEGGFGVVFMADQLEPVRRRVALKIIKPGMDTKDVIARFEAERQALALMEHPNIAHVLDAGATDSGRPYFVMELVKGVTITTYCDQNNLTPRERLELFVTVCHAIQHAHQKGIIHRDVKPSNVLITLHDGNPVVKVIDFGVAKAINQRLTERTLFTRFSQLVGTPMYMSPEQAEMSGLDVDTRTDVYSLGVLLYELVTGTTPFDRRRLNEAGYDEMRRIIREEDPPRPSRMISGLGETLTTVSAHRKTEPRKLCTLVRGELDWIVMRSLSKERGRRYETASGFADDVLHYLRDEPVVACPPSTFYRWRKLVRRHKVAFASTSVVGASLLCGIVGTSWQAIRATIAQEAARQSAHEATRERNRARDALTQLERESGEKERNQYFADMIAGKVSWDENNMLGVIASLKRHVPRPGRRDHRDFLWYHLWDLADRTRRCNIVAQLPDPVVSMSLSPRNSMMAVGFPTNAVLVDGHSGRITRELGNCSWYRSDVLFSPDGTLVVYPRPDAQGVIVLDIESGVTFEKILETEYHGFAFSPSGRHLIVAGDDMVQQWEVRNLNAPASSFDIPEDLDEPTTVAYGHDDNVLVVGTRSEVVVWSLRSGNIEATYRHNAGWLYEIAVSPSGTRMAAAARDGTILIFDDGEDWIAERLRFHTDQIYAVAFSPDGELLAAGSRDGAISLWDAKTLDQLETLRGHSGILSRVTFRSRHGRMHLVSSSQDYTIRSWDVSNLKNRDAIVTGFAVNNLAVSRDGKAAAISTDPNNDIVIVDLESGEFRSTGIHEGHRLVDVAFSQNWSALIGVDDNTLEVWEFDQPDPTWMWDFVGTRTHAAFSNDGSLLAMCLDAQQVEVRNISHGSNYLPC